MNPNTPTSRRSRSSTPQQQEANQQFNQNMNQPGFAAYSHGFQGGFQPGGYPHFPQPGYQQFSQQGFQHFPQPGYQQFPEQRFSFQNLLNQGSQAVQHQDFSSGFDHDNDDDDDDVEEFVPETQQPPQTVKGKGKGKKFENRAKRQYWTIQEEVALARAWVDVSEDPVVGNGQNKACFYDRILNVYHNIMGRSYRTKDQVTTKFSQLNKQSAQFGALHNNLVNSRQSGQSDQDIMDLAYSRFQDRYSKAFTFPHVWEILKQCPKWEGVSPMQTSRSSKRTNPTSDDDEVQHQRPIGRDKAKRRGKPDESTKELLDGLSRIEGSFSNTASEYRFRKLDIEKEKIDLEKKKIDFEQEKLRTEEKRIEHEKTQRLDDDLRFYVTPHDHLTGTELQSVLFRKQHLKKYHGFEF